MQLERFDSRFNSSRATHGVSAMPESVVFAGLVWVTGRWREYRRAIPAVD